MSEAQLWAKYQKMVVSKQALLDLIKYYKKRNKMKKTTTTTTKANVKPKASRPISKESTRELLTQLNKSKTYSPVEIALELSARFQNYKEVVSTQRERITELEDDLADAKSEAKASAGEFNGLMNLVNKMASMKKLRDKIREIAITSPDSKFNQK